MADKKITDLQLRGSVTSDLNIPSDDGIQSYRVTSEMLRNFVLTTPILQSLIPSGTILDFGGPPANIPSGFLYCNGQAVSRTTYATLFAAIGTSHGEGDGSTTFNLPDRRGVFARGLADGSARDPDRASRTAPATGGNTGDNVGSIQGHAFQTHTHTQNAHTHNTIARWYNAGSALNANQMNNPSYLMPGTDHGGGQTMNNTGVQSATATNQNAAASGTNSQATANETRPLNVSAVYMIKA